MFSLPPVWSPCQCVLMTKRMGSEVTARIAVTNLIEKSLKADGPSRATGVPAAPYWGLVSKNRRCNRSRHNNRWSRRACWPPRVEWFQGQLEPPEQLAAPSHCSSNGPSTRRSLATASPFSA